MKKLAAVLALLLLVSGCSAPPVTAEKPPATAPSATSTPTSTPTGEPWVTYTTPDASTTFDLPADWSVEITPWPAAAQDDEYWAGIIESNPLSAPSLKVFDEHGAQRLSYVMYFDGVGGACVDEFPLYELDTAETSWVDPGQGPVRFVYNALETPEGVRASLGLAARAPAAAGCLVYFITSIPGAEQGVSVATDMQLSSGAGISFDSIADATAYIDTEEYQSVRRIILSFTFA